VLVLWTEQDDLGIFTDVRIVISDIHFTKGTKGLSRHSVAS
jgi:hypothetical protein